MAEQRKKESDRRVELLRIMDEVRERAGSPADFTAEKIAAAGSVSVARVRQLIGPEFKVLKKMLNAPRRAPQTIVHQLRKENTELRSDLKDADSRYDSFIQGDAAGAIRIIEAQDQENRLLRGEIKLLKKQLKEFEEMTETSFVDTDFEQPEQIEHDTDEQAQDKTDSSEVIKADGRYSN